MKQNLLILTLVAILFTTCKKEDIDQENPVIDLSAETAFPQNCDTIWFGEEFTFSALLSDNRELGSFSIEIHENFDHHAHSTDSEACALMPEKESINPFHVINDYEIPPGQTQYAANIIVAIPDFNSNGTYDEGDYHFFISLTDRQGWPAQKGIGIKLLRKENHQ